MRGYCSGLIGTKGVIEVMPSREIALRMRGKGRANGRYLKRKGVIVQRISRLPCWT